MMISAHGPSASAQAAGKALESGDSTAFVFVPIAETLGGWAANALAILLATSLFAGLLAFHNSANRYLYALGRDGLLPRALSVVNRRQAPMRAGLVQTALAILLILPFAVLGKDPVLALFSWFSGVAVLAMMLLYFLTSISVLVFFRRERVDSLVWNTLIAPALGAIGLGTAIWLILSNFPTLIGGDQATATWLALAVPGVLLVFAVLFRLRRGVVSASPA